MEPTHAAKDSRRDALSFLPGVAEKLGWYVYALRDPRTNAIFYIGKGTGDRAFQHARYTRKVAVNPRESLKLDLIHDIHAQGHEVGVEIIRHQIKDDEMAYEVEGAMLDTFALLGIEVANEVSGHGSDRGWRPLEDINLQYAAEPATIAPDHRVVLIRINRQFRRTMVAEELYEATRKWWAVAPHYRKPDFAFSVYAGIVRAVYRIRSWERHESDSDWAFHGDVDAAMEDLYVWKDVSSYLPTGAQNPIRYVHC
jgi:hypothetical protein